MTYIGSRTELNDITGVVDVIALDNILESEYANKVFKPNILIWKKTNKTMYLTDGEKPLSQLDPITVSVADILNHINDTTIHSNMTTDGELATTLASLEQRKMDKTADSTFVHVTGDETIAGTKAFSNTITGSITGSAGSAAADGNGNNINNTYLKKSDASASYATKAELTTHASDNTMHMSADARELLNGIVYRVAISDAVADAVVSSCYE